MSMMMKGSLMSHRLMLPELINANSHGNSPPLFVSLMTDRPVRLFPGLRLSKDRGAIPFAVIKPGTPMKILEDLLPGNGILLRMCVAYGFVRQIF